MDNESALSPLELEYYSSTGIDIEPGIRLCWLNDNEKVFFYVEWKGDNFLTYVRLKELSEFPEVTIALKDIDFTKNEEEDTLERKSESAEFLDVILDVRRVLLEISG